MFYIRSKAQSSLETSAIWVSILIVTLNLSKPRASRKDGQLKKSKYLL